MTPFTYGVLSFLLVGLLLNLVGIAWTAGIVLGSTIVLAVAYELLKKAIDKHFDWKGML